jgi:pyridoxal phosphate enzyme (YggS family)
MKADVGDRSAGTPDSLVGRIANVREQLADACRSIGRDPSSVRLVGVTKTQSRETVLAAIAAGLGEVAENYVQEARPKFAGMSAVMHFVGHVQANKAKAIVETFDVVQSIDRISAGRAIAKASRGLGKPVKTLVQVNVSPTERYGVAPDEAPDFARVLRSEYGLDVDGVMAIGPLTADRSVLVRAFLAAAAAFERVGGSTLSLGMSGDWREAIACGSTMVRLGTTLFGPRKVQAEAV